MIYLFLGFLLSIFTFLEIISRDKKIFYVIFVLLIILLILFVGLRDGTTVGIDSPAYYGFYSEKNANVEYGYKFLNIFFSQNNMPYNIFLLTINSIALINLGRYIKLNSYYLIFPLFIYFSDFYLYFNFSGIRQAIAMSFVALSIFYIFENKRNISLLLIFMASLFHVSSLVFLLALFVPKEKMKFSKYFNFLIILVIGVYAAGYLIEVVPYLNNKFMYYSSLQEHSDNILSNYYVGLVKRSIVLLSVFLVYRNFFNNNKNFFLYNLYLVGFIIYLVSYLISPEFGVRLGSYFIILDCILVAKYIHSANSLTNRIVIFTIFSLIAMYKIYTYTLIPAYTYKFFI